MTLKEAERRVLRFAANQVEALDIEQDPWCQEATPIGRCMMEDARDTLVAELRRRALLIKEKGA